MNLSTTPGAHQNSTPEQRGVYIQITVMSVDCTTLQMYIEEARLDISVMTTL